MAETLVLDEVCSSCGKEARPHALFCYHCGGSLEPANAATDEPSDVWFRGDISENKDNKDSDAVEIVEEKTEDKEEIDSEKDKDSEKSDEEKAETQEEKNDEEEVDDTDEKIQKPDDNKLEEVLEEKNEEKIKVKPKPFKEKEEEKKELKSDAKLKSASALRRRAKPDRLKKIEISWEEQDDSPNIWFIVFGLVFTLFVLALVFLAFYLK